MLKFNKIPNKQDGKGFLMLLKTLSPKDHARVCLETKEQKRFRAEEAMRAKMSGDLTFKWYDLERKGEELTTPAPVIFSWEEIRTEEEKPLDAYYFLLISEHENMNNAVVYTTQETSLDVYNLKVGTTYFWCVQKEGKRSETAVFATDLTLPRCIRMGGIANVRDMGGYAVEEGVMRQGLVYRGGEFERHMHLTPDGIDTIKRLGLRTDLDMRGEAIGKVDYPTSELFGMTRVFVPSVPYEEAFSKEQRSALKRFYMTFTSERNYPIYYHCWGGADRTGTFAYILGALCGMSREDLIFEYEFTSLSIWGIRSRNYQKFRLFEEKFLALTGETLREKAAYYLKKYASLTERQIERIYTIMVEKNAF